MQSLRNDARIYTEFVTRVENTAPGLSGRSVLCDRTEMEYARLLRASNIPVNFRSRTAAHLALETPTLLEGTRGRLVMLPHKDDIVVREKSGDPLCIYHLGTFATPEQFLLQTRDEAVSQAVAFAKQLHVRVWFNSEECFVLLGNYTDDERAEESPARVTDGNQD